MRTGRLLVVLIGSVAAAMVFGVAISAATSNPVGPPIALGPHALNVEMQRNPEIATLIQRRGYPDWAERVEVDNPRPLDDYEVHVYYLRLNKEYAFTRSYILGVPQIGLREYERPLEPGVRERIMSYYRTYDPANRAEAAAEHAEVAAEHAEGEAALAVDSADRAQHVAQRVRGHAAGTKHHRK